MWKNKSVRDAYHRWTNMNRRCFNANDIQFKDYGLRGIHVCHGWYSNWKNYEKDTRSKPFPKATIDRINNDKGYTCGHCLECIENCWPKNWRWATRREQNFNRRRYSRTPDHPMKGVEKRGNRFRSQVTIDGKTNHIGTFDTAKEAHEAFLKATSHLRRTA